MATYYFTGVCKWAHVHEPVENYDKTGKLWSIDVSLDDASEELFEKSGLQLRPKKDKQDGKDYVQFRRPTRKVIKDKIQEYAAPSVLDASNEPITAKVGNGSKVTVKVEAFKTRMGTGHTLEAIRVDHLIPYGDKTVEAPEDVVPF